MPFLYSLKNEQKNERNYIKGYYYAHFINYMKMPIDKKAIIPPIAPQRISFKSNRFL